MTPSEMAAKYFDRMGRINLWSGIAGMRHMEAEQDSHRKNREAEEQYVRKTAWGYDEPNNEADSSEADKMGNTILGDVQQTPPVIVTQAAPPAQPAAHWLLPLVLGAMVPGGVGAGALATYLATRPQQPQTPTATEYVDESTSIGLGRIEDYLRDD